MLTLHPSGIEFYNFGMITEKVIPAKRTSYMTGSSRNAPFSLKIQDVMDGGDPSRRVKQEF